MGQGSWAAGTRLGFQGWELSGHSVGRLPRFLECLSSAGWAGSLANQIPAVNATEMALRLISCVALGLCFTLCPHLSVTASDWEESHKQKESPGVGVRGQRSGLWLASCGWPHGDIRSGNGPVSSYRVYFGTCAHLLVSWPGWRCSLPATAPVLLGCDCLGAQGIFHCATEEKALSIPFVFSGV